MGAVDCVLSSGQYQFDATLNAWNGTGASGSVGSVPIKLQVNGLVSSSSDGDGESANRKNHFRVVVLVSGLSRSNMRDQWGVYLLLRLHYNHAKLYDSHFSKALYSIQRSLIGKDRLQYLL